MKSTHPDDRPRVLADFAPELASTVVRVAGDIALVVGDDGIIRNVAAGGTPLSTGESGWVGQLWADTVSEGGRQKLELLLQEAQHHGVSQRREVNHPLVGGNGEIPVSWAAVRLGDHGPVLAVGRDLRSVSAIQQKFLDAQQQMEREYWLRRQADERYRQLFQVATDAVIVVDSISRLVLEANPAAKALLGLRGDRLHDGIAPAGLPALDELLTKARATGRAGEVRLRAAGSGAALDVSATPFRSEGRHCLLVRARRATDAARDPEALRELIVQTPDAVVVTDSVGRVLWANPAFVELCQAVAEVRVRGLTLAQVLGGDAIQWGSLLAQVRSRGVVGQATVSLRPAGSPALLASVSAALLAEGDQEHIGFTIRRDAATAVPVGSTTELTQDMAQLFERVGSLPLDALLGEASRMAEIHFIRAAVRASDRRIDAAAAMLGVAPAHLAGRMQALGLDVLPSAGEPGTPGWLN
jgi:transcriptional regulator PpsR